MSKPLRPRSVSLIVYRDEEDCDPECETLVVSAADDPNIGHPTLCLELKNNPEGFTVPPVTMHLDHAQAQALFAFSGAWLHKYSPKPV